MAYNNKHLFLTNLHGLADPGWAQLIWSGLTHVSVAGAHPEGKLCSRGLSSWKLQASLGAASFYSWQQLRGQAPVCRPGSSHCLHHNLKRSTDQANPVDESRIKEQGGAPQLGWEARQRSTAKCVGVGG